ncbi:MAG: peptide-methionine (S)-S-oxide reductase MsrA [Anaerolineae bacterium]|jgi:peptide-methionine (S)-S-oxide reductase|nr:peptide-methionine (S)-S-oxide reductase MsrA [Anaerolineae bacterium]
MSESRKRDLEVATLGGGCFWCLEAIYDQVHGVEDVVSGYAGGTVASPSYELVCSGATGHAEVVQVAFDPEVITYGEILDIFFSIHDPTTLNRQGADVGTQYRSVIFTHRATQHETAQAVIRNLEARKTYTDPIVTQVTPLQAFYPAEDYHQEYFAKHPERAYCRAVISPKVAKFQKHFSDLLKVEV